MSLEMANTPKTVIVTGGSQGIGSGAVKAFLDRGYNVVATSRDVTKSRELPSSPKLALVDGELAAARAMAIACGYKDSIDHDRLRHDPLMKAAVGRCPQTGALLASQSTISRLENAPSKTEAARLAVALLDQFGTTMKPGRMEILDIDDTFCAAHGGQQLAFWNAQHHDERGSRPSVTLHS
jgi:NAD(P)-dependent dehydrogenase (short-subunit alcohol dehydrogenase family)